MQLCNHSPTERLTVVDQVLLKWTINRNISLLKDLTTFKKLNRNELFIADSHVHGQMIAWANYAGDISKLCLRVVAIKAWRATKNKFQGWWSVHLGLKSVKLHWFIRILYGAEFLTIFFKKLSRVLLGDCGKKSRQTENIWPSKWRL